jgi:hypothetical protein
MNKEELIIILNNEKNPELLYFILNNNDIDGIRVIRRDLKLTYKFKIYDNVKNLVNFDYFVIISPLNKELVKNFLKLKIKFK